MSSWLISLCIAAQAAELVPIKLAENVYAFYGQPGEISARNQGRVGNSGFIIGDNGIVVIDTGGSYAHGRDLLRAIRKVSNKKIRLAIITHPFQEFLFGAAAFVDTGVPLLAHAETAKLIRGRCSECLERSRRYVGEQPFKATRIVVPEDVIDRSLSLDVHGVRIELHHFGWGATPGDLVVYHRQSGVAFVGALVSVGRILDLHDWNFGPGWLAALTSIEALAPRLLVPGHGPAASSTAIHATRDYLAQLDTATRAAYAAGIGLSQALDSVELPHYRNWDMYTIAHRQNVQRLYLRLEQEDLAR